jgi:hypothetical protein
MRELWEGDDPILNIEGKGGAHPLPPQYWKMDRVRLR